MNIFVLDRDVKKCAQYHCDKHLVKMITEHNQILGTISYIRRGIKNKKEITEDFINKHFQGFPREKDGKPFPYGIGFKNHPCTIWANTSSSNYKWLTDLTSEMCKEYTKRYGRKHAGEDINNWYLNHMPEIPDMGLTQFPQAMPEDCKMFDPVDGYRNYYKKYKVRFAKWQHSETPKWWLQ
jgi:hypothetical protein